jgi:hypothetical protein
MLLLLRSTAGSRLKILFTYQEKLNQHSALVERALLIFYFYTLICSLNYWLTLPFSKVFRFSFLIIKLLNSW